MAMRNKLVVCITLVFIFIPIITWSQIEKGAVLLGGQLDLNFSHASQPGNPLGYAEAKTKSLGFAPQFGYFILKNIPIGFELLYNNKKTTTPTGDSFSRTFSFVPFFRSYFGKGKLKPYIHAGLGPGMSKTGNSSDGFPEHTQSSKLLTYEVKGGIEYLFNKNIGFDFGFGYKSTTTFFKEPLVNGSYDEWNNITNGTGGSLAIVFYL
jgi:opacity protein-like surface antigen